MSTSFRHFENAPKAQALVTPKPVPPLPVLIELNIGESIDFNVIKLTGVEELCEPFAFDISVITHLNSFDEEALCNQTGCLKLSNADGISRLITGLITHVTPADYLGNGLGRIDFHLVSPWAMLASEAQSRIILYKSPLDILKTFLLNVGYAQAQIHFDIDTVYEQKPLTVQAPDESDLDFFHRLARSCGLCYWDTTGPSGAEIFFTDRGLNEPSALLSRLDYINPSQQAVIPEGFYEMHQRVSKVAHRIIVRDYNEQAAGFNKRIEAQVATGQPYKPNAWNMPPVIKDYFGHGALTQKEALHQAQVRAAHEWTRRWNVTASSNSPLVELAHWFAVDGNEFSGPLCVWDLVPTRIEHQAQIPAGSMQTKANTVHYTNTVKHTKRSFRYCAAFPNLPKVPPTFTAVIESDLAYAQLDAAGFYKLKFHHDRSDTPNTQASIPIQRVLPHVAPSYSSKPAGFHSALYHGAEVLVAPINGDPGRPLIIATLPNGQKTSPVTAKNRCENRYQTQSGHALVMDDATTAPKIQLHTPQQAQQLNLDATPGKESASLIAQKGDIAIGAGTHINWITGGDTTETIGENLLHIAGQDYSICTAQGDIQHQAQTSFNLNAGQDININTQGDMHVTTAGDDNTVVGKDIDINIAEGDSIFQIKGNMLIQGETLHFISNTGPICIAQKGGGLHMADDTITLFGKNVNIVSHKETIINAKVNYFSGPGPKVPVPQQKAPLVAQPIQKLGPEGEPTCDLPAKTFDLRDLGVIDLGDFLTGEGMAAATLSFTGSITLQQSGDCNPLTFEAQGYSITARQQLADIFAETKINVDSLLKNASLSNSITTNSGTVTASVTPPNEYMFEFSPKSVGTDVNGWSISGTVGYDLAVTILPKPPSQQTPTPTVITASSTLQNNSDGNSVIMLIEWIIGSQLANAINQWNIDLNDLQWVGHQVGLAFDENQSETENEMAAELPMASIPLPIP